MKRIISCVMSVCILLSAAMLLAGCNKDEGEKAKLVSGNMEEIFKAVSAADSFDGKISEMLYKSTDEDEMICLIYGLVDMPAYDHLTDYAVSMPSDYCHTYAVFVFDDTMPAEEYDNVISVVTKEYTKARASSLQMYAPEEYNKVKWALENESLVWRRYDNALALIITGDSEATAAWTAFESAALK